MSSRRTDPRRLKIKRNTDPRRDGEANEPTNSPPRAFDTGAAPAVEVPKPGRVYRGRHKLKVGKVTIAEVPSPDLRIRPKASSPKIGRVILKQIETLIRARHGGPCDTDDGEEYFDAALPQLLLLQSAGVRTVDPSTWAKRHVPRVTAQQVSDLTDDHKRHRHRRTTEDLGRILRVTDEERERLQLWNIWPIDLSRHDHRIRERRKHAERDRRRREKRGAIPRDQALSRTRPWEDEGISRATWYRRRPPAKLG
jgi:hypothetical protein